MQRIFHQEGKYVSLRVVDRVSFRGGKFKVLQVYNKEKLALEVPETDGFKEIDLGKFASEFEKSKLL